MMQWALTLTLAALVAARGDRYHPTDNAPAPGAAPRNAAEGQAAYWAEEARASIAALLADESGARARRVVMFLGDGMSVPTLAAARTALGQRRGGTGEEAQLSWDTFPTVGLVKTYCVNAQVADSACSATAYLCGAKANRGTLGVTAAVPRGNCAVATDAANRVSSIAQWALADGRDAGIVTTTRVTHASPAGAFAHAADRGWENDALVWDAGLEPDQCPDIAHQLVHHHPGNQFKVIFGGGRRNFLPNDTRDEEGTRGRRTDGRNLIEEWQRDKAARNLSHAYMWHAQELRTLAGGAELPDYLLGLFEGNHLQYHAQADADSEPSLAELTELAIRALDRNEKGFFLFVEGGRIDHAHHSNLAALALDETIEMAAAVQRATELLSAADSLVVVTADHAHVMSFNGYAARGADVLGPSGDADRDGVPYMTLSYTNGPGARAQRDGVRPDVTLDDDYGSFEWATHADVPLGSETHGGDDVAVFAWGAGHALLAGLYEQSQLPHRMAFAACLGAAPHACSAAHHAPALALLTLLTSLFVQLYYLLGSI